MYIFATKINDDDDAFSVATMHNPYANHNPASSTVQNHVMGAPGTAGVPDVHKRDKDAIYG